MEKERKSISLMRNSIIYLILFYLLFSFFSYIIISKSIKQYNSLTLLRMRSSLKEKVQICVNLISPIREQYVNHQISKDEAIQKIRTLIKNCTYEDDYGKNYIFVNKMDGTVIVRPFRPLDEMQNHWNMQDSKGNYIMQNAINAVRKEPLGTFTEYLLENPTSKKEELKHSYLILIPELDIHIGTGAYLSTYTQKQLKLIENIYFLGIVLSLILSIPFIFSIYFFKKQNRNLINEIKANKQIQSELIDKDKILKENNEKLSITLNSIGDGVIATDIQGQIVRMNPVAEKLTGYSQAEALGAELQEVFNIINAETRQKCQNPVEKVLTTGAIQGLANHTVLISRDKTEYQIADSAAPIMNEQKEIQGVVLVFRDVTEEYKLKEDNQTKDIVLKTVFDVNPHSLTIQKLEDNEILFVNDAFTRHIGYSKEDVIGKNAEQIGMMTFDEFTIKGIQKMKSDGLIENYPLKYRKKGSETYNDILLSAKVFELNGEKYVITVSIDISDYKELEEKLSHAQKMDAIGQLAGGVAHDFNNMIGAILGTAELMLLKKRDPETHTYFLNNIIQAANRAADLTRKLLLFSRKGKIESTPVDVHKAIKEAVELLKRSIDKRIKIEMDLKATHSMIIGEMSLLMNVFLNMGINSSHAIPGNGSIRFSTRVVELDDHFCNAVPFDIKPDLYLLIEVHDTGQGIPKQNIKRIFEPFFTTKEQGKGTGLGLAAVYGTILQHKGAITVYSEVGKGTQFHIYLPLIDSNETEKEKSSDIVFGKGCVLVVDDEDVIRIMAKSILEYIGYDVLIAEDGKQAIDIYKENQDKIHLVLLDMVMPEMNGKDCFYHLKSINEKVKVIISSGFSQEEDMEDLKRDGVISFVRKPYHTANLSKVVSAVFEQPLS